MGKLRTPAVPKPMSRLPSELKWTSPALEPPLALPMAAPHEDAAIGLDRQRIRRVGARRDADGDQAISPEGRVEGPVAVQAKQGDPAGRVAGDDDLAIRGDGDTDDTAEVRERNERLALLAEARVGLPRGVGAPDGDRRFPH